MRGYGAAMIGVSHGAVQFVCYEELKSILRRNQLESDLSYFVSGALSKLIATTITYPYQVLRTRIQVCCMFFFESFFKIICLM